MTITVSTPTPLSIESTSQEPVLITTLSGTDPTVGAVEFELTALSVTDPTGSWTAGTWEPAGWSATTLKAQATSPNIGGPSGAFALAQDAHYRLWVRFAGTIIRHAATITAT